VVKKGGNNVTHHLAELDGTLIALPIAGKIIKIIKRRDRLEIGFDAVDHSLLSIDHDQE
jgi:hypothetical protein